MGEQRVADYALVPVLEHLGPDADTLDAPWAAFAGDRSSEFTFAVPAAETTDVYLELQAYDIGTFGHEIVLNGEALSGFDVPPGEGWQYWMDAVTNVDLREGENTVRVHRDTSTSDAFAVGNIVVNWRAPLRS